MNIRKLEIQDLNALREIGILTFTESFASQNSKEDMDEYLEHAFSETKLKAQLNDTNTEFYGIENNTKTIGYLKINFGDSQTEIQDQNTLEIERIYVQKEFQRQKIGQLLFEKAFEIAKLKKVKYIWLGVWEKNLKAIRFYEKNGFVAFDKHIFKLGSDIQTDIMMKLKF